MGHPVHAALVLVDVRHEPVTEHAPLPVAEVDTADMPGEVSWDEEHSAVGAGGRDHVVNSGHVIIQPRHSEATLGALGLMTLMRGPNVTLQRGWGLELLGTLGALIIESGLCVSWLLLLVADILMLLQ